MWPHPNEMIKIYHLFDLVGITSRSSVGSWVINNKFLMGFDDEQKLLMKSKTFELKMNTLESLELRNKAIKATHVRERVSEDKQ